jgi:hypothetical protein
VIGGRPRHGSGAGNRGGRRAPRVPFAVLVTGLVIGAMALLLALNTFSAANELQRHDLALRDEAVAAQVEQLQNEVAASAAPANLASAAAALGMVPAGNPAFLVDVAGKVIVRGKPSPVPYPVVPLPTSSAPTTTHPATSTATSTPTSPAKAKTTPEATSKTTKQGTSTTSSDTTTRHYPAKHDSRTASTPSPTPAPTPTPTPTPTVTLPGGPR